MCSPNKKVVHLFHWPSFREYQENLIQVIALPIGTRGQLYIRKKWVNNTFINEVENINKCDGFRAIFWVLSCTQAKENDKVVTAFDFACPVRLLKILKVEVKNDYYFIDFIAQEFISEFKKIDKKNDIKNYMKIEFDGPEIPYPGVEKGYVYTGPKIDIETSQTLSLESLYKVLENIPCSSEYKEGITIKDYPLVRIGAIKKSKVNKNGLYELSINQEYKITFSYYQGEPYRNRAIYIHGNRFIGKSVTDAVSIEGVRKSKDKINIEVKCDNLSFVIPLNVAVKIPWYKWRFTPFLFVLGLSAISVCIFMNLYPGSNIEVKVAMFFPLLIILLDTLREVLT